MSYIILEYRKFIETHKLSGIALLVDNKLCLVLPKKFKNDKKYSIPKGHIEDGKTPYHSAYLELLEETGINIGLISYSNEFNYGYRKNGIRKQLTVFVIKLTTEEFEDLRMNRRDKSEIYDVRLVTKGRAMKLVEPSFRKLITHIYK